MDEEQGLSSPIAGGLQGIRRSVSSSVFSGRAVPPPVSDPQTTNLLNQNSLTLTSISTQLSGISESVGSLNTSLIAIKDNLAISDEIEKNKEIAKRKREAQLAEEGLREGKESELEKKIQFALLTPVRRVAQVGRNILGRLTDSLLFLASGWLTVQALRFLQFTSEGNLEALKKLKDRFLKDLLLMGGLVLGLTVGFGKVLTAIGNLSRKLIIFTFGGSLFKGFGFLGSIIRNNVSKFFNFIRSGLGKIGLRGIPFSSLKIPGAALLATLQGRILKFLKSIPVVGELFKGGRKPFDPKTANVAKVGWISKFFNAIIVVEKAFQVFTDYNKMRDKGLTKFQSIAISLGKLAVDIGLYLALVKGTSLLFGKIGAGIGAAAGFFAGGPIGSAALGILGAKAGAGLGTIVGTLGYFFPGALKAITGGIVDIDKLRTNMRNQTETLVGGLTKPSGKGEKPGKIAIKNKRGRIIGYKDAPEDESVVPNNDGSILSAEGVTIGSGEVVPFKTSNNGDKLAMDSNVANIVDATVSRKSKNATGASASKGSGIDNTPNIESSNPNDNSSIVAEATFNIT